MEAMRDTTSAAEATETIICRPAGASRQAMLIVIFSVPVATLTGFVALFAATGQGWMSLAAALGMTIIFWPLCIWGMVYLKRAHVIADENGLQWCVGAKTRRTPWGGVSDYFDHWERSQKTSALTRRTIIQTTAGKLVLSPGHWTKEAELRACVAKNALQCAPEWRTLGGPAFKLPLRCHYATTVNRNILGWMDSLHKYGLAAVVVYFALQWFTTHTLPGWGWLLTPTGLFVIGKQLLPLLLRPTYQATQPRLNDQVVADKDGLRFVDPGGEIAVDWEDITDFYSLGIRSVIVTPSGEYDFLETLTNAEQLKLIVPVLATNANQAVWRTGTVRRQQFVQTDGQLSAGCLYHYRSQENCGRLWGLTLAVLFLVAVTLGPTLIAWQFGAATTAELEVGALGLFGLSALLWLWANYWICSVRTDETGITQTTLLGQRRMTWNQIRSFRWRGSADLAWGCVDAMSGTIKFWKGIGDADRLADEITAHLNTTH